MALGEFVDVSMQEPFGGDWARDALYSSEEAGVVPTLPSDREMPVGLPGGIGDSKADLASGDEPVSRVLASAFLAGVVPWAVYHLDARLNSRRTEKAWLAAGAVAGALAGWFIWPSYSKWWFGSVSPSSRP